MSVGLSSFWNDLSSCLLCLALFDLESPQWLVDAHCITVTDTDYRLPLPCTCKDPKNPLGPTWVAQDNLLFQGQLISTLNPFCRVM